MPQPDTMVSQANPPSPNFMSHWPAKSSAPKAKAATITVSRHQAGQSSPRMISVSSAATMA